MRQCTPSGQEDMRGRFISAADELQIHASNSYAECNSYHNRVNLVLDLATATSRYTPTIFLTPSDVSALHHIAGEAEACFTAAQNYLDYLLDTSHLTGPDSLGYNGDIKVPVLTAPTSLPNDRFFPLREICYQCYQACYRALDLYGNKISPCISNARHDGSWINPEKISICNLQILTNILRRASETCSRGTTLLARRFGRLY